MKQPHTLVADLIVPSFCEYHHHQPAACLCVSSGGFLATFCPDTAQCPLQLHNNTVTDNVAEDGGGGAAFVTNASGLQPAAAAMDMTSASSAPAAWGRRLAGVDHKQYELIGSTEASMVMRQTKHAVVDDNVDDDNAATHASNGRNSHRFHVPRKSLFELVDSNSSNVHTGKQPAAEDVKSSSGSMRNASSATPIDSINPNRHLLAVDQLPSSSVGWVNNNAVGVAAWGSMLAGPASVLAPEGPVLHRNGSMVVSSGALFPLQLAIQVCFRMVNCDGCIFEQQVTDQLHQLPVIS